MIKEIMEIGYMMILLEHQWIDWVSLFMKTVKYNFAVSGKEIDLIIPKRGLRQGDPISPIFFSCVRK